MKLDELHHQVLAVDLKEERVNEVLPYVTSAQIGDGTNEDFLASLGVGEFRRVYRRYRRRLSEFAGDYALFERTGSKKMVVSRAARDVHAKFLLRNGADEIVYPEKQMAQMDRDEIQLGSYPDYIELDEEHAVVEITVPAEWQGKTVGSLDIRKNTTSTSWQ